MPVSRVATGTPKNLCSPNTLRAVAAEFLAMVMFVFAGQGSGIALHKLGGQATEAAGLVAASLAHAFGLFVAVAVSARISGGHVNPAVTLGAIVRGKVTLMEGLVYWVAQCLGSIVACSLLKLTSGGLEISCFSLSHGVGTGNAVVLEMVMTFGLVFTVYATAFDPNKMEIGIIAPIAIGFIVGANILAGGPFDGASMNPAVSFGPAVVSWTWDNHWVYWIGPLAGAGIAALIYEGIFINAPSHV